MLLRPIRFAARAGVSKSAFAQQVPFSSHFIRVVAISQNIHRDFQGLIILLHNPLSSAASAMCATARMGRAAGVCVCPNPAGSRLQRAHEADAGQQGANGLPSQHALIRGTDTLLIISPSCQPVFASSARHFQLTRRLCPLLLSLHLLVKCLTAYLFGP